MNKFQNVILPNFATVGTLSCFFPHKSLDELVNDPEFQELLLTPKLEQLQDILVRYKAQYSHKRFQCAPGPLLSSPELSLSTLQ